MRRAAPLPDAFTAIMSPDDGPVVDGGANRDIHLSAPVAIAADAACPPAGGEA